VGVRRCLCSMPRLSGDFDFFLFVGLDWSVELCIGVGFVVI